MAAQVLKDRNGNKIGEIKEEGGKLIIVDKNVLIRFNWG